LFWGFFWVVGFWGWEGGGVVCFFLAFWGEGLVFFLVCWFVGWVGGGGGWVVCGCGGEFFFFFGWEGVGVGGAVSVVVGCFFSSSLFCVVFFLLLSLLSVVFFALGLAGECS